MFKPRSRDTNGVGMYQFNPEWLAQNDEPAIDPELPIIDPHHHLWDRDNRYLFDDLLDDTESGHNIRSTVYIQCRSMFRADGPVELQPIGETEFVNGVAAMSASGHYGHLRACAGIVGYADLRLGAKVRDVLEAQIAAGGGRFRGIRFSTPWDEHVQLTPVRPDKGIMPNATWREGFAQLAPMNMTYDSLLLHTQIGELTDLARKFPQTTMVLNHVGCPMGLGPYASRRDEVFAQWKAAIADLGKCENVVVKLGGFGMHIFGYGYDKRPTPPLSPEMAQVWKPYFDVCVAAFGPKRSMFESNFPVDKISCSYKTIWNTFKRMAAGFSKSEKADLFHDTAARVYRLPPA
ncbi:MAG: amidohydrolase family protein [Xanthobacteraceae bacterium]